MILHPIFESLSTDERAELLARATPMSLRKGQTLVKAGGSYSGWFIVVSGLLRVEVLGATGKLVTTGFLGQNSLVGESLESASYVAQAEVTAALNSYVYTLSSNVLKAVLTRHPEVALKVIAWLLDYFKKLRKQIGRLNAAPPEIAVGRALYELAHPSRDGGRVMDKRVTQGTVAAFLGMSREQVNKTMKTLEERGLVTRVEAGYAVDERLSATNIAPLEGLSA